VRVMNSVPVQTIGNEGLALASNTTCWRDDEFKSSRRLFVLTAQLNGHVWLLQQIFIIN
jgi:hypothetical protein